MTPSSLTCLPQHCSRLPGALQSVSEHGCQPLQSQPALLGGASLGRKLAVVGTLRAHELQACRQNSRRTCHLRAREGCTLAGEKGTHGRTTRGKKACRTAAVKVPECSVENSARVRTVCQVQVVAVKHSHVSTSSC